MELKASEVSRIFIDCLFPENYMELPMDTKCIMVEGITRTFGFKADKIEEHVSEIKALLDELQPEFHEEIGGGYTFMSMPFDKNGTQWGEQINAQELMVLGIAAGWAKYLMPRPLWVAFPGGVPYIMIPKDRDTSAVKVSTLGEVLPSATEMVAKTPKEPSEPEIPLFSLNISYDGNFLHVDYGDGSGIEATPIANRQELEDAIKEAIRTVLSPEDD